MHSCSEPCGHTPLKLTVSAAPVCQADLARARSAHETAAGEAGSLRVEADSLRKALRAMEARLAEYQAKDTEVGALLMHAGNPNSAAIACMHSPFCAGPGWGINSSDDQRA